MAAPSRGEDQPKESAAAPAPTAAPTPPAPDPANTPTGMNSTGGKYTGASMTASLTGDKDAKTGKIAVTPETLAKDVKLTKTALNIMWTLITGFLVMFMQAGFALVETGMTRAKN